LENSDINPYIHHSSCNLDSNTNLIEMNNINIDKNKIDLGNNNKIVEARQINNNQTGLNGEGDIFYDGTQYIFQAIHPEKTPHIFSKILFNQENLYLFCR
jgi:hypothetical protein